MDHYNPQYLWDSSVQMFSYDPKHPVYSIVIWNQESWTMVLQSANAPKEIQKYAFEYQRIGGTDPFAGITAQQFETLKSELESQGKSKGFNFVFDYVQWMSGDDIPHYAYPRFLYNGPAALRRNAPTAVKRSLTGHGPAATLSATMLTGRSTGC